MEFEFSKKTKMYAEQLGDFMNKYIYPNEKVFQEQLDSGPTRWQVPPIMEELKTKARERALWNLFLPESERGAGLTNLEYAPLCEIMGRSPIAPEVFNCSAPDTGNMEVLERYGTPDQKKQWLEPLLQGKIRSAFAMTEPKGASSDASNMLLGDGRGFEIAQGRLGPGRIHHCMRQIGVAERALELMCKRAMKRVAFGKPLAENDITLERIAQSRIEIDQARLLVLHAAHMMDTVGNKAARQAIAEIKVAVPNTTLRVIERAMQLHGGGGVSQEFPLASMWAHSRTLRFADGPDEVHRRQIGRLELRKHG